jgi:hypothetical protein
MSDFRGKPAVSDIRRVWLTFLQKHLQKPRWRRVEGELSALMNYLLHQ